MEHGLRQVGGGRAHTHSHARKDFGVCLPRFLLLIAHMHHAYAAIVLVRNYFVLIRSFSEKNNATAMLFLPLLAKGL